MIDLNEIYKRKSQFATRIVGDELIIVPLRNNVTDMNALFTVNEVGCFIWEHICENITERELTSAIMSEFDVDENIAKKDMEQFIRKLKTLLFHEC